MVARMGLVVIAIEFLVRIVAAANEGWGPRWTTKMVVVMMVMMLVAVVARGELDGVWGLRIL